MLARFALRRVLDSLPVLLGVSIITFALVQARIGSDVPGLDQAFTVASTAGIAVPAFWTGLVAILLFAVLFHEWDLPALPTGGVESALGGGDPFDRLLHLVLPATVLSFGYLAIWSRYVRSG